MPIRRTYLRLTVLMLVGAFTLSLNAENEEQRAVPGNPLKGAKKGVDELGRYFDNLFATELPFIGPNTVWEFDISPKFGDVIDDPYIRLPLEATYGFSETLEASLGYTPYLENPFDSDPVHSDGYLSLGFKKRFAELFGEKSNLAVGASVREPLDDIPEQNIRANYLLFRPFVVYSLQLGDTDRWTAYWNVNYDLIGDHIDDTPPPGRVPDSLFSLKQGVIYKIEGEWRCSLELEYQTTRMDGEEDDQWVIRPGVTWFPSEKRREAWFIPGDYSVGVTFGIALDQLNEHRDRSDFRTSVRFRWRFRAK
ncbi:transporter [Puniceicoccaceae bacterium K14]|nr:transporter [Puniceicoccaceae bacterium K14]